MKRFQQFSLGKKTDRGVSLKHVRASHNLIFLFFVVPHITLTLVGLNSFINITKYNRKYQSVSHGISIIL